MASTNPLLNGALDDFDAELISALRASGHSELSKQISALRIVDRCDCGRESCATFYTASRPAKPWGEGHFNLRLPVADYGLILDFVGESIVCVEILGRSDLKLFLDSNFRTCTAK